MPQSAEALTIHIRWMVVRDLPAVLAIEEASFASAWTEADFLRCLRHRSCMGMVAEHEGLIVGFMVYELHKARTRVLDFAVSPGHRRRGVGSRMAATLIGKLSADRQRTLTVNVSEGNLIGQLFFQIAGFRAARVLPGYFSRTGEDAYRMVYRYKEK